MFGILNINKPAGWTSRDVVNRVGRLVGKKIKCGHAGTLDPLATGVLLVCVGKATKLVPYLHDHFKSYRGTFLLGKSSPTDDIEGELLDVTIPDSATREALEQQLPKFIGEIEQIPPAYSAIRVNGERAYKAARRGEEIEMPSRIVHVSQLELTDWHDDRFELTMTCGTGTYVRSIGRDLARLVGTDAAMSSLIRTSIGGFAVQDAVDLDQLSQENIGDFLTSPTRALTHLTRYTVTAGELKSLSYGQRIGIETERFDRTETTNAIAVVSGDDRLVAIVTRIEGQLAPQLVFATE